MLMCFMHACMYVCTLGFRFIFKQEKMYYLFQNALLNCEWFNMPFSSYSSLINLREKSKTKIEESTPFPIMYVPSKFSIYGSCSFFFFLSKHHFDSTSVFLHAVCLCYDDVFFERNKASTKYPYSI